MIKIPGLDLAGNVITPKPIEHENENPDDALASCLPYNYTSQAELTRLTSSNSKQEHLS